MANVGDTVWVRLGDKNEEPGTVLELNATPLTEGQNNEAGEARPGAEGKGETSDGGIDTGDKSSINMHILVRTFDGVESVVSLDKCRFLGRGRNGELNNLRRSTRATIRDRHGYAPADKAVQCEENGKVAKANKSLDKNIARTEAASSLVIDLQEVQPNEGTKGSSNSEDEDGDSISLAQIKVKSKARKEVITKKSGRKRKTTKKELSKPDPEECGLEVKAAKKRRKSKSITKKDTSKNRQAEMSDPSSPYFQERKANKPTKKLPRKIEPLAAEPSKTKAMKKKSAATKKKVGGAKKKVIETIKSGSVASSPKAGTSDGNGGLDQGATYIVEHAKTARSTCKRCDIRIQKGVLRVGHRPLFRGKPGYRVFKHLQCIVFSEDVTCAEDITGHELLGDDDYSALAKRVEESFQEIKAEKEDLEPDELVQKGFEGELRPVPKGLTANLLPFQAEGASWMYNQEKSIEDLRGGILADEMGMGKTVQTITTILDNRPRLQRCVPGGKYPPCTAEERKFIDIEEDLWKKSRNEWEHEMKMNDVHESLLPKGSKKGEPEGGARSGTLVVCPLIALSQWKSEIEKFSEGNALSVCVYHGPDRVKNVPRNLLIKYDIVLTTYQVLEADFRKMVSPNKVKCPNCGGKFKVDKLRIHLKYFCGEGAQRTEAQSRTIRNSERGNAGADQRPRGRGNSSMRVVKDGQKKDKTAKKVINKDKKNIIMVKSVDGYASESDLSGKEETVDIKRGKSPRGAAVKARGRLKSFRGSSLHVRVEDDSDENFSLRSNSDSGSDFDDEMNSSSEDDHIMKKAVAKQAQAMKRTKAGKKTFPKEKNAKKKIVGKKKNAKKVVRKGQKKKSGGESGASSDNESDSDEDDIDMNALVAEAMAGARMSNLHSVCWWRIVLDEAHMIKSRSSQTSHAAFALTGIHRWCLSGTPLQNRVGEFYSLIRFLRLDPMAHYMCRSKDCNCKQIHYRMMHGKCRSCGHGSIQHYSHFNRHILNPIQRDGYSHDGRRAMFVLKNEVLDKCLLRRTKENRAEEMNLPPRVVTIKAVRLHPVEEDFYNALYTQTTSTFNDYVTGGTLLNNYAHIFDLLMRMRQSVAHPYLVVYSKKGLSESNSSPPVTNGRIDCHLCSEPPTERIISSCCQTAFCKSCVLDYMELSTGANNAGTQCPQCNQPFTIDLNQIQDDTTDDDTLKIGSTESISTFGLPSLKELPHVATGSILRKIDLTKFATSTKIEALTKELVEMRKTSPGSKAIVFSQFVNMLDLIRWRLHSDPFLSDIGLRAGALHGGMDLKSRDAVLKDFREDPNVRVLLVSLKAGGVALNLTVANYVYLMDPWWNPAAELQAIDRTHRLGQYRPIRAVRFIAENTVEERILQLQEKKRLVFDGTVGRDAGSLKMLTVDDMKSLFA